MNFTTTPTHPKSDVSKISSSEILPIVFFDRNFKPENICFQLSPGVDREIGNRLSWRFCKKFTDIVVIWYDNFFWAFAKPNQVIPDKTKWSETLTEICQELKEDIGDRDYTIQWVCKPQLTSSALAELIVRVLKIHRPFSSPVALSKGLVEVKREAKFWGESIEIKSDFCPAFTITIESYFSYQGNLAEFYENNPYRQNPEELLIGLKVRDIEQNSFATITEIVGNIGEYREKLKENATGAISKQALEEAPDEQPVVAVQFGKNRKQFYYAMAALRPCVTSETAAKFDVKYGDLLKAAKVPYRERKELLELYKREAETILADYGFRLGQNINSSNYPELFWQPSLKLSETRLLFGNNITEVQSSILTGLSKGGVYRRHGDYSHPLDKITIAALKIGEFKVSRAFLTEVEERLRLYGFENITPPENIKSLYLKDITSAGSRAEVEENIDDLMEREPDVILIFLPKGDRNVDDSQGNSLYSLISSRLLKRGIASQFIYEDTLEKVQTRYLLHQVIPGILAKLGNLPFVLAEPLQIADYFIGLDVSRNSNRRSNGSRNACASLRFYGRMGEFCGYKLEDALIEGEEIPQRVLENFIPREKLRGKRVLIYRDGRLCGKEALHLQEWGKAIGSEFILVECYKSGIPRLYNLEQQLEEKVIKAPTKGLALRLSSREAILVTTELKSEKMGLPLPLRLRIHKAGIQVSIEDLVETTLKLTLLHHGSLKEPRLPIPVFGSDRIAYRRLQGIYPGALDGDRQFWL
ncbi:MAG: Piwi domain-containing protein [Cyanobacteria bacterium P01_A01_bin.45]